jgi:hypothetical protein
MTDTGRAEKEREPSFVASFTAADWRLLVMTFTGTLAANVVTVVVVALAVIVARYMLSTEANGPHPNVPLYLGLSALCCVVNVPLIIVAVVIARKTPDGRRQAIARRLMIASAAVGSPITLLLMLILLGAATGVR